MRLLLPSALLALAAGCSTPAPVASPASSHAATPVPPTADVLVTEAGVPRKVLIVRRDARAAADPGAAPAGAALPYFRPLFVFAVHPERGPARAYRVGTTPRRESALGWVEAGAAVEWNTRVGMRYVPPLPLLVYDDPEALREVAATGRTAREPIARAAPGSRDAWAPWPVAEVRSVAVGGQTHEFVRLHFLGEFKAGADLGRPAAPAGDAPRYSPERQAHIRSAARMLTVVFVVDNTSSTAPFLAQIRAAVTEIARQLHALPGKTDLAIGLVLYRDHVPAIMFADAGGRSSVTRSFPLETDLAAFLRHLPAGCAEASSEDFPEAMYDGVRAGLGQFTRGDGLDNRVLVLVSDNSAHPPGHRKNPDNIAPDALLKLAAQRNVKLFSLCIRGAGSDAEQQRHREQCEELARGAGGACFPLGESGLLAQRIRALHEQEVAVVDDRGKVIDALASGKSLDQSRAELGDVRRFTAVMEFFGKVGIDPAKLGPGVPHYATGWVLPTVGGQRVLEPEVYLSRAELSTLLSELNALCAGLGSDFAVRAGEAGGFARIAPRSWAGGQDPEPFDVYLAKKLIPTSTGLLRFTRRELESWDEARRLALRERVERQLVPALTNARSDNRTFTFLNEFEYGWIGEAILP